MLEKRKEKTTISTFYVMEKVKLFGMSRKSPCKLWKHIKLAKSMVIYLDDFFIILSTLVECQIVVVVLWYENVPLYYKIVLMHYRAALL